MAPYSEQVDSSLVRDFADDIIAARRAINIPDEQRTLTTSQYEILISAVNRDGRYDSLVQPGSVQTQDDYGDVLPNPGPSESYTCVSNPFDCRSAFSARGDANKWSAEAFPQLSGINDKRDAYRHCLWQALTTLRSNEDFAAKIGDAHEKDNPGTPEAGRMDQNNNVVGRSIGATSSTDDVIRNRCLEQLPPNPFGTLIVLVG